MEMTFSELCNAYDARNLESFEEWFCRNVGEPATGPEADINDTFNTMAKKYGDSIFFVLPICEYIKYCGKLNGDFEIQSFR